MYRVYMSDVACLIARCIAGNEAVKSRYYDILHPQEVVEVDGDAIAADIIKRLAGG